MAPSSWIPPINRFVPLARALVAAATLIEQGRVTELRANRYAGWRGDLGTRIDAGSFTLATLADYALERQLNPQPQSGRQELFEALVANASSP